MRKHASLFLILIPVAFAAVAPPSYSQATTAFAQLNGTVRDASGGFVARASIALREVDTNREYAAVSNETGFYVVDRKSTRLNSSHANISYAVFCLKKKKCRRCN